MSKGLGKVERKVLKAVKRGKTEGYLISCFVFGLLDKRGDIIEQPSAAQHKSVLRAINRLAGKNLLKVARVKVKQYRHRLEGNAAWTPYAFPSQRRLTAFCKNPPKYVIELKVNGKTIFDRFKC